MTKILVITDNQILFSQIRDIFKNLQRKDLNVVYSCSEKSNFAMNNKKIKTVNVKNEIKWIIANFDIIFSVHCFQFFPKKLVNSVRCINIHPGFNPINRGWYPQVFSIIHDLPIGATIHEMDEKLDHGPIIAREKVEKFQWDTSLSLYARVLQKEVELFKKHINQIIDKRYKIIKQTEKENLFRKTDFHNICQIDLNEIGSFKKFYNLLRGLSHEPYNNAYIINEKGEKIYLKLQINKN
jgi:dTDP-4-amino-4,6-dideoxyglucose formyltransferase